MPAISDKFVRKADCVRHVSPQTRLHSAQRIVDWPHMQLSIYNAEQDRITIGEPERTPNVDRNLQTTSAHQLASLRVHVKHPISIQIRVVYTFFT